MLTFNFDNRFVNELPGDPETANQRRKVHGAGWSRVEPAAVAAPRLLAYSPEVAALLDLPVAVPPAPTLAAELAAVFGGNKLLPGMRPYAACYGGHQFGN